MNWALFDAALFDLDGVLTPTTKIHQRAWTQMFSTYFEAQQIVPPYGDADYFAYVDGRPRYDGVRAALASRGVVLAEGHPSDLPGTATVCGLGNAKNVAFDELLARGGVDPYPGSVALLDALAVHGLRTAVVSSSRNTHAVLVAAGLADRFDVVVDGEVAVTAGLTGKPSPQTFLHAATALGAAPDRCVVVEDAVSGVAAGRAGGFGLVVGVDRGAGAQTLLDAGADVVVRELDELVGP